MTLPPHLVKVLVDRGVLTERGTSRAAKARRCRRCGAAVVSGLDFDVCAADVDVEPVPLTYGGAICARLAGLPVYTLSMWGRVQIDYPPGFTPRPRLGVFVVHRHACGFRTPDAWRAPDERRSAPTDPGPDPPF